MYVYIYIYIYIYIDVPGSSDDVHTPSPQQKRTREQVPAPRDLLGVGHCVAEVYAQRCAIVFTTSHTCLAFYDILLRFPLYSG